MVTKLICDYHNIVRPPSLICYDVITLHPETEFRHYIVLNFQVDCLII